MQQRLAQTRSATGDGTSFELSRSQPLPQRVLPPLSYDSASFKIAAIRSVWARRRYG